MTIHESSCSMLKKITIWQALVVILCGTLTDAMMAIDVALAPKFCVMERVHRMLAYNCIDLRLKEVPQYMKSGVELMELSENRIRDLTRASFEKYTDLKYLYLHDNMIQTVETGTFSQLYSLEVLDLSTNALTTLPLELFHIATLRTLYAADNNFFHLDLKDLQKPISAPLQIISFSSCKLQTIPDVGVLPNLLHANFSRNPLTGVDVMQLAPMCNLKTIDLNGTDLYKSRCECQEVRTYLANLKVYIKSGPLFCDNTAGCITTHPTNDNATLQVYADCVAKSAALVEEHRKSSILFYTAIAGGCLLVVLLLCCCFIRNRKIRRQRKRVKKAAAARKEARRLKKEEARLLQTDRISMTSTKDSSVASSNVVQVDIEKVPPD